jgi:hypothetical protein
VLLLESWRDFELAHGDAASQEALRKKMPKKIKKRRKITAADGVRFRCTCFGYAPLTPLRQMDGGWEEFFDYVFPSDLPSEQPHLKLLEMAHRWKQQKERAGGAGGAASSATAPRGNALHGDVGDAAHVAMAEDAARGGEPDPDTNPIDE